MLDLLSCIAVWKSTIVSGRNEPPICPWLIISRTATIVAVQAKSLKSLPLYPLVCSLNFFKSTSLAKVVDLRWILRICSLATLFGKSHRMRLENRRRIASSMSKGLLVAPRTMIWPEALEKVWGLLQSAARLSLSS